MKMMKRSVKVNKMKSSETQRKGKQRLVFRIKK